MSSLKHRLAALGAAAAITAAPLLVSPSADAAALTCIAGMSDSTPSQYSNVYVKVKTASYAKIKTVAHYKTTSTVKRGQANSTGRASIKYYISGATPGFRVRVNVTVTKNGRSKSCATSFVAHR